jgi:hypothetical protein
MKAFSTAELIEWNNRLKVLLDETKDNSFLTLYVEIGSHLERFVNSWHHVSMRLKFTSLKSFDDCVETLTLNNLKLITNPTDRTIDVCGDIAPVDQTYIDKIVSSGVVEVTNK